MRLEKLAGTGPSKELPNNLLQEDMRVKVQSGQCEFWYVEHSSLREWQNMTKYATTYEVRMNDTSSWENSGWVVLFCRCRQSPTMTKLWPGLKWLEISVNCWRVKWTILVFWEVHAHIYMYKCILNLGPFEIVQSLLYPSLKVWFHWN